MIVIQVVNGRHEFEIAGRYFELISTVSPVDLEFWANSGRMVESARQVSAGFYIDRADAERFSRVVVTTGAAEEVKFHISDGLSGNRSLPADISDDATRELGLAGIKGVAVTFEDGASVTVDAQIRPANTARKKLIIQVEDSVADLYITLDGTAATADYESLKIAAGETWEPFPVPTGEIRGISSTGTCNFHVIEG